jgi:isocitrate dehydrogenase (NAD+)
MAKRTIVAMPGDGIGKAVLDETIRVLTAAGFDADYVEGDIGWEFWCKEGNPLPERTIKLIENIRSDYLVLLLQNQKMKLLMSLLLN